MPITFGKTNLDNSLFPSIALFGLMKSLQWLNTLSTEAEVAGTQKLFPEEKSLEQFIGAKKVWQSAVLSFSLVKKLLVSGHCLVKRLLGFKFHQKPGTGILLTRPRTWTSRPSPRTLSLKAKGKAKDFKMCSRGSSRTRTVLKDNKSVSQPFVKQNWVLLIRIFVLASREV